MLNAKNYINALHNDLTELMTKKEKGIGRNGNKKEEDTPEIKAHSPPQTLSEHRGP